MSEEQESGCFLEVDVATARAAYKSAFETIRLTPEELLLGKVDENGEIRWMGYPRWLAKHPGTVPTVKEIVEDMLGPEDAAPEATDDEGRNRGRSEER